MGSCCSSEATFYPNTEQLLKPERKHSSSSEEDNNIVTQPTIQSTQDTDDVAQNTQMSQNSKENIYAGWKTAAQTGNDSLLATLLEEYDNNDLLERKFDDGNTALHIAVKKNYKQSSLILVTNGAEVNSVNDDGDTPLHFAVRNEDLKMMALLLKYKADPTIRNKKGQTVQDVANSLNIGNIVEKLLKMKTFVDFDKIENLAELQSEIIDSIVVEEDNEEEDEEEFESPSTSNNTKANENNKILFQISHNDPFRAKKLTKQQTKKMLEGLENFEKSKKKLPTLEGWLEKKKPNPPYSWQKRWVVVKDSHLLWSDRQRTITDASKPEQRKLFNGFLNLMVIQEVKEVDSKSGKKFVVIARDAKRNELRDYEWKAGTQKDRDYWIAGLNAHKNLVQSMANIFNK